VRILVAAAAALLMFVAPALGERLVAGVSRLEVAITSSFDGETLTFFGNVEPDPGVAAAPDGPYHVVVVVTGPLQDRVARKKSNVFGVWLNTNQVLFESFPTYLRVLSDARLADITDPITLAELGILPEQQAREAAQAGWWDSIIYSRELVRLMTEESLFGVNEQGVTFRSNTLYSAQIQLQSNAPPGTYLARTYLFKDGQVVANHAERFSVRKTGFERFLGLAAVRQPLLYGIATVVLALFTGWLGGVVFRR
jgi:uncharacterized protein (TIGR02186 family)